MTWVTPAWFRFLTSSRASRCTSAGAWAIAISWSRLILDQLIREVDPGVVLDDLDRLCEPHRFSDPTVGLAVPLADYPGGVGLLAAEVGPGATLEPLLLVFLGSLQGHLVGRPVPPPAPPIAHPSARLTDRSPKVVTFG